MNVKPANQIKHEALRMRDANLARAAGQKGAV